MEHVAMATDSRDTFELITQDNGYGAKLVVPTRSDGATLSTSGWEIGGNNISRTSSKGELEEKPYEDIVHTFIIYGDHIEMGVMLETGTNALYKVVQGKREGPKRTIRIPMADVTDVRAEKVGGQDNPFGGDKVGSKEGMTFETSEDVYQMVIYREKEVEGILDRVIRGTISVENGETRERAIEKIEVNKGTAMSRESSSGQSKSIADDLKQLKDLHNSGVLTDEEFKAAKSRLLE